MHKHFQLGKLLPFQLHHIALPFFFSQQYI